MDTLQHWHEFVKTGNTAILDDLLSEEVVFFSPVVWTPQQGRQLTKMYLIGAMYVLGQGGFRYTMEIVGERQACLEFETQIGEITVNGVDLITWGADGRITEFKVMVRPLKAVNAVWQGMAGVLEKKGL